jgi:hypothetical protein
MAFVILNNGNFFRIAKTQSDINDINIPEQFKTVVDISDDDFVSYVTNLKESFVTDENVSFSDYPSTGIIAHENESVLKAHFDTFKELATLYTENNSGKQLATEIQNYVNYLNTVDTSSLSYPINWEKYCHDNSITFFHKDQIG